MKYTKRRYNKEKERLEVYDGNKQKWVSIRTLSIEEQKIAINYLPVDENPPGSYKEK